MVEEALNREFANFNFNDDEKDLIVKAFVEMGMILISFELIFNYLILKCC